MNIKRLKKKIKSLRAKAVRLVRILRYGDAEKVSFFEIATPERIGVIAKRGLLKKKRMKVICNRSFQALKRAYVSLMMEDQVLTPDLLLETHKGEYAKYLINGSFKNAFCLIDRQTGEVQLSHATKDVEGIYLFVGRQLVTPGEGVLEVGLKSVTEKRMLCKKVDSLHDGWDLYYLKMPDEFKNENVSLTWRIDRPKERVFVSAPIVKRRSKERTMIVLVLDAVRPQEIGLYGLSRLTPNIDRLFSKGCWFNNSYSQSNWTLPAFASMMTGQYASNHKVVDPDTYIRSIDRSMPTLAELLRRGGFYTYGSFSHRRCNHSMGHHRGFEHFSFGQTVEGRSGSRGTKGSNDMHKQLKELKDHLRNMRGVDFFGFTHFFDTHFPYLYTPGRLNDRHLTFQDSVDVCVKKLLFNEESSHEEREYVLQCYQDKLLELDEHLGELFRILEDRENTTVILTSDHGCSFTSFLDNGLSDEEIRTPFLVYSSEFDLPKGASDRFVESSIDLLPTVVSLSGARDTAVCSGSSLFDRDMCLTPKRYAISELVYHGDYQLRLMGEGVFEVLTRASRDRSSFVIHTDTMKVVHHSAGELPMGVFKERCANYIDSSGLNECIKIKAKALIDGLDGLKMEDVCPYRKLAEEELQTHNAL